MRTKDKANNMVLNRGSSRRELARVGICGDVIRDKCGDNKEDNRDNKNKDVNKDEKENKDEDVYVAVLPALTLISPIT